MQTIEMNKKAITLLEEWDPFNAGRKAYSLEIADVLADLQVLDHPTDLAKRIREIYEHSYQLWIPLEKCMQISYKLLAIKYEAKCIV
ncbi:DUF1871 family protein [Sporosarcina highlanderae]|uniref:DUF1871 family protein n=1 Tax=Sporosarcina highlanderae TaxID=3035916 RepID=A0ABT8JV76_9BACL|nr:DUF1871 family protein [Sporosarcina highlanderae]MDN4609086.1 DUF1871 family protein [Sporosarcina highlanderae]